MVSEPPERAKPPGVIAAPEHWRKIHGRVSDEVKKFDERGSGHVTIFDATDLARSPRYREHCKGKEVRLNWEKNGKNLCSKYPEN